MVAKVTMAKTRVYQDEPQIFIITGLTDRVDTSDWWKFARFRYEPESSIADSAGWRSLSDSPLFTYDAHEITSTYGELPTTWNMDQVRELYAKGITFDVAEAWVVLSWNPATGTMAVYDRPHKAEKYRYELEIRQGYQHAIEWTSIPENMPEDLRQEYLISEDAPPADTSLKFGDLSGRHLLVNNIQDVSAGVEVAINNNSSHTGTAIVHVEIRDSAGIAVAVAEDASAHFDPAPFLYVKTWPVITLLQPSTNYTAHYTVFDSSNGILLSGGGVSFKTNAAPVHVTPLDITGISATKTTLAKGESVTFTITHNNGGLKPIAWSWYLNGGPFSGQIQGETATTMQTTLQEPGTYMITGQGVDAAGDGDYAEITITVTDSSTPAPATGKSGAAVAALFIAGAYALSKAGKGRSILRV